MDELYVIVGNYGHGRYRITFSGRVYTKLCSAKRDLEGFKALPSTETHSYSIKKLSDL